MNVYTICTFPSCSSMSCSDLGMRLAQQYIYIVLTVKFRLDLVQSDAAEKKSEKKSKYNNNNNFLFIQLTHNPETH